MVELIHPECATKSHPCFTDKMRLWRGGESRLATKIPDGWKGPSVAARARRQVAEAKAAGVSDPQLAADRYRWV